jgi:hypothetical protein
MCSHCLFQVVVTSLEQVVITVLRKVDNGITDLLQVFPTRLFVTSCYELVNKFLRADDIRLVGTTCCESVGLVNLVTR